MNFKQFTSESTSPFKRTITAQAWASEIKTTQGVASLEVSNILQGVDKDTGEAKDTRFVVVTLANGASATVPASKKATVGAPITDYMFGENDKGEWVVVTGTSNNTTL